VAFNPFCCHSSWLLGHTDTIKALADTAASKFSVLDAVLHTKVRAGGEEEEDRERRGEERNKRGREEEDRERRREERNKGRREEGKLTGRHLRAD
jgi:hypothetical protein